MQLVAFHRSALRVRRQTALKAAAPYVDDLSRTPSSSPAISPRTAATELNAACAWMRGLSAPVLVHARQSRRAVLQNLGPRGCTVEALPPRCAWPAHEALAHARLEHHSGQHRARPGNCGRIGRRARSRAARPPSPPLNCSTRTRRACASSSRTIRSTGRTMRQLRASPSAAYAARKS